MEVLLTQAKRSDLEKIVSTYNSTILSSNITADLEPVTVKSKLEWFKNHSITKRPLWIILLNGEYAGWMSFSSFYGRPAYDGTVEVSIYLEESTRGLGVGKACLNRAFSECSQLKIKTLLGFIFDTNEKSLKLFYKMGFEKWGHLPKIANMINQEVGLVIVGKRIT
ncbi:MAG: GNAT family N-acetyltransferase [Bacteroidota bacterium]|jgi:phosphinothricin acetyltransferase